MTITEQLEDQGYPLTAKYYLGIRGLASKLSYKYGKFHLEDDFVQVALATACKAELRYDNSRNASFYTYINKIIKSEIQKEFGNPNRHTKKYKVIQKFIDEFNSAHGRYPEVQDISKGTSLSRFEVLQTYYDRYQEESLTLAMDEGMMKDPFENKDHAWVSEHLDVLSADEAYLVDLMYTQELTLDIVAGTMGIPKVSAYRIHESALEKLKQSIKDFQ